MTIRQTADDSNQTTSNSLNNLNTRSFNSDDLNRENSTVLNQTTADLVQNSAGNEKNRNSLVRLKSVDSGPETISNFGNSKLISQKRNVIQEMVQSLHCVSYFWIQTALLYFYSVFKLNFELFSEKKSNPSKESKALSQDMVTSFEHDATRTIPHGPCDMIYTAWHMYFMLVYAFLTRQITYYSV